jgi:hypothetical protein
MDATKSILRQGADYGVTYTGSLDSFKCVACIKGRLQQAPFIHRGLRHVEPGELIHVDICGPFPVLSQGCRFFIIFLDDATNFGWTFPLKHKDEACGRFKFVVARLERQVGCKVKRVCVDGAGELSKGALEEYFKEEGIVYQVTARYAHQQNGKAERYVRTIQDRAASLMAWSMLPYSFYLFAADTGQWVQNRLCTSALPSGVTPYEVLYGTKPDLSALWVFGCRCFVLIPPELQRKGDGRRFEAIFLGYEADRKGWKVMGVDGRLTFSHDVVFDENTLGRLLSKKASVSALQDGLLDSTAVPEVRRSRRLQQLEPEDAGADGVVLLAGDDQVDLDEALVRSADDWFALYVAADVARRGSLDGGVVELGGVYADVDIDVG